MGWAYCGQVDGREVGYGIEATCDKRGCDTVIDRGLGCICGKMHHSFWSDEPGCGRYFCAEHVGWVGDRGGCQHRQKRPHGLTLCQLLVDDYTGRMYCACGLPHDAVA